jgi:peroxin-13
MYGGMGGMGGMYGGMGGMGSMYGGMGPGMGEDPNSLTNSFSQSTQATFQIIESIVGAFGGFAQMLESTYMATHSSFFGKSILFLRRKFLLVNIWNEGGRGKNEHMSLLFK